MVRPLDICIRGGGIVGLTLALLLARSRLQVGLVAAAPGSAPGAEPDVRAYALNAESRSLLESVRCWPDAEHATPVAAMQIYGDAGGEVRFDAVDFHAPALAWIVDAAALHQQLEQAGQFAPEITRLAQPQAAGLQIVCEGGASESRTRFGAEVALTRYPQHAVATRLRCALPHGQVALQWFSQGEVLGVLPIDGAQGNSVAIVWSVSQERALELLQLDPADFCARLRIATHDRLGEFELISARCAWPLKLTQTDRWTGRTDGQSWALAGDAAHTVHPLSGQGLNLGLADAGELARVIGQRDYWRAVNDEKLLRRYERARKADVMAMGVLTDGLQQLFAKDGASWRAGRNLGMRGFERSGPLKHWMVRHAMGRSAERTLWT